MKRVDRKNSLFVGNPRGGRTAAILASLTSTCRRDDVDPQLYFMQVLVTFLDGRQVISALGFPTVEKQAHAVRCAALGIPAPSTT
jgi:hypothetical protein